MNVGKKFEEDVRNSLPDHVIAFRVPDAAQSFGRSENLRFSRKNPFDFLLWDSIGYVPYALELKTVRGNAISFERSDEDAAKGRGDIHKHQIDGLAQWDEYDGTVCGFIIGFREAEKTIFIYIADFLKLMDKIKKKSFTLSDLDKRHIPYYVISQELIRVRYRYDMDSFIRDISLIETKRRNETHEN